MTATAGRNTYQFGPWKDVDQVERAIFQWVTWYNEERLHSALDHVPPAECERGFRQSQEHTPTGRLKQDHRISTELGTAQLCAIPVALAAYKHAHHSGCIQFDRFKPRMTRATEVKYRDDQHTAATAEPPQPHPGHAGRPEIADRTVASRRADRYRHNEVRTPDAARGPAHIGWGPRTRVCTPRRSPPRTPGAARRRRRPTHRLRRLPTGACRTRRDPRLSLCPLARTTALPQLTFVRMGCVRPRPGSGGAGCRPTCRHPLAWCHVRVQTPACEHACTLRERPSPPLRSTTGCLKGCSVSRSTPGRRRLITAFTRGAATFSPATRSGGKLGAKLATPTVGAIRTTNTLKIAAAWSAPPR
ncbi:integrase core domain-containing protein [Streptomyces sp. NPDC001852]|uniref:integrase core domain-containing protein n=1 Tax=Streptomyces sp. NPDC001852 TaxID=3364619 RepID=UPI0036A5EAA8